MKRITHAANGFTLVELLVVIAVLIALQLMLIPSLSRSRVMSKTAICENNLKQVTMGWQMYSAENRDRICPTGGMDVICTDPTAGNYLSGGTYAQWCLGSVKMMPGAIDDRYIRGGLLFPYINNVAAYKCPLDTNTLGDAPTIRSISMNCWMNPINMWAVDVQGKFKNFRKYTDITRPATTFLVIDENPAGVNDGWFISDPSQLTSWVDIPTANHDGGAPVSFCDGSVETKKWSDRNILKGSLQNYLPSDPTSTDLQWLQSRTTY